MMGARSAMGARSCLWFCLATNVACSDSNACRTLSPDERTVCDGSPACLSARERNLVVSYRVRFRPGTGYDPECLAPSAAAHDLVAGLQEGAGEIVVTGTPSEVAPLLALSTAREVEVGCESAQACGHCPAAASPGTCDADPFCQTMAGVGIQRDDVRQCFAFSVEVPVFCRARRGSCEKRVVLVRGPTGECYLLNESCPLEGTGWREDQSCLPRAVAVC